MLVAQLVLLVPLIAMYFSEEVDWKSFDFITVGILLAGLGLAYELMHTDVKRHPKRLVAGVVIVLFVLVAWVELAVGIFNTPIAGS